MSTALTHHTPSLIEPNEATNVLVNRIKKRIQESDALFLSTEKTLNLVDQLSEFPLGRFLLHNRGLNGYWTAYVFRNQVDTKHCHPLENWLLTKSLYVMARERLKIFQHLIQENLFDGIQCASLPCGLMDDFLQIDYRHLKNFSITGIDADSESLVFAKDNAKQHRLESYCQFIKKDAWNLDIDNAFDLLSSNGLNMYESSHERLVSLYKNFSKALVAGGKLLLSFIPPPPKNGFFGISESDFLQERAIFGDIVQVNYLNFSSEDEIKEQLALSGFCVNNIIYNQYGVAPVLVAIKL